MSSRDDYPTALFLVRDEPEPGRKFDNSVHAEINAMFDEIDRLRAREVAWQLRAVAAEAEVGRS